MPKTIPADAQDLIKKLLVLKPENRLGASNIQEVMNHKFFQGIDFETIDI